MFFRFSIAAVILLFSSIIVYAAQDKGVVCNGCSASQKQNIAVNTAGSAASFGVTVFVVDFIGDSLNKYFVLSGSPLRPELQKFYESLSPDVTALSEEVVKTRSGSVTAVELALTAAENSVFNDLIFAISFLIEHGVNPQTRGRTDTNPVVTNAFTVPTGIGADSAFNVIDAPFLSRQVGTLAQSSDARIGLLGQIGSNLRAVLPAIDTFVNLNSQYEVFFSDGSSALFAFDDRARLDVVPGSFRDSNDNNIPDDASDIDRVMGFTGVGLPNDNDTMNSMIDRLGRLGRTVDTVNGSGSGSGGSGGTPRICTITCTASVCFRECF